MFIWNYLSFIAYSYSEKWQFPGCPTHQIFVDVDWFMEDCPNNCFCAVGGGQGAHVPIEFCKVCISNQVINRDGFD